MGVCVCQYARYINVIAASGYALGMHRGTHQVITLSVKLGGGFWRTPIYTLWSMGSICYTPTSET